MFTTTKGIVLKTYKFSESSIICKVYTEAFGIRSYIIRGVGGKKRQKSAHFQPLTVLDLVVEDRANRDLNHVREISISDPIKTIYFNVFKSSIALFTAEVLLKSIKEEEANLPLFALILNFIFILDRAENSFANYHLLFMLHLTKYLGFSPKYDTLEKPLFFDMLTGCFSSKKPLHSAMIEEPFSTLFYRLTESDYEQVKGLSLNGQMRTHILEKTIAYYAIHLEGMGQIHSAEVLKMLYADS